MRGEFWFTRLLVMVAAVLASGRMAAAYAEDNSPEEPTLEIQGFGAVQGDALARHGWLSYQGTLNESTKPSVVEQVRAIVEEAYSAGVCATLFYFVDGTLRSDIGCPLNAPGIDVGAHTYAEKELTRAILAKGSGISYLFTGADLPQYSTRINALLEKEGLSPATLGRPSDSSGSAENITTR